MNDRCPSFSHMLFTALALTALHSTSIPPPTWGADVLADTSHADALSPALDQLYLLGFSRTGRFAFVTIGCGDEAGYVCAHATVMDLADDRVLAALAWDDDGASGAAPVDPQVTWTKFVHDVDALLRKHGIDARGRWCAGRLSQRSRRSASR